MISEQDVEKAVDYLRSSAHEAAVARANMKYLTEFLKTKKAQLSLSFTNAKSATVADSMALADPAYVEVLEGYKVAVEKDAFHGFKREAAGALIDAWRTQQSNARAEGRLG